MNPAPAEYLYGSYFERPRSRFQICGTRAEAGGVQLVLRCIACGLELNYGWLKKPHDQPWTGSFGDRLKHHLVNNYSHRKCRKVVRDMRAANVRRDQTATVPTVAAPLSVVYHMVINSEH